MNLGMTFNRNELPENDNNFEPIPAGWYQAQIEKAEVKATKAGNGSYMNVQYKILGPQYAGRVVFGMITIQNPNSTAEEIGKKEMGSLMDACALVSVNNTDSFIGKTLTIKVKVKPATGQYEAGNDVSAWKPAGQVQAPAAPGPAAAFGGSVPAPAVPQAPAQAQGPAAGGAPPWATQ